jgi:hypothetical protein
VLAGERIDVLVVARALTERDAGKGERDDGDQGENGEAHGSDCYQTPWRPAAGPV